MSIINQTPDQLAEFRVAMDAAGVVDQTARAIATSAQLAVPTIPAVVPDVMQDQAVVINAALANAANTLVFIPAGTYWTARTIEVPANKTLQLDPRATLKALPTFAILSGKNHGVLLSGNRAAIIGGTVDMNKRGLGEGINSRYNGITVLNAARDCIRRDVVVKNCTGYGVYDSGEQNLANMPSSSNYNVRTENCEIHFEPQGADGTTYVDCSAGDGDGDVSVSSYFHPLVGSKNITNIRMRAKGKAPAGVEMTPNTAHLDNITLAFCDFELTTGGACLVATAGQPFSNRGLKIVGGSYKGAGGAASLNGTFGAMTNVEFVGVGGITQSGGEITYNNCSSTSAQPVGGSSAAIPLTVDTGGIANWNSGRLVATGGSAQISRGTGRIRLSGNVVTVPFSPSAPLIRYEQFVTATVVGDTGKSYANVFLSFTEIDRTKVQVDVSVQRITAGYLASGNDNFHWSFLGAGYIRIYFDGGDFSGSDYNVTLKITEFE